MTFKPGELVDITIRQAKVIADGGVLTVTYDEQHNERIDVMRGNRVTVERVAPADWPPEVGDVWRDRENVLWFISLREVGDDFRTEKVFTPSSTRAVNRYTSYQADRLLADRGPLTLVHREHRDQDGADL
ncbi:hypothetical protein [Verrucosispora sp. TAA-831]|uniref:hypothetical protein n=1 Tax=Verrucosispora sp. TAA-831 TaxID=3422227 RepID=UPI003D6E2051